jgi:hypothetical protein
MIKLNYPGRRLPWKKYLILLAAAQFIKIIQAGFRGCSYDGLAPVPELPSGQAGGGQANGDQAWSLTRSRGFSRKTP